MVEHIMGWDPASSVWSVALPIDEALKFTISGLWVKDFFNGVCWIGFNVYLCWGGGGCPLWRDLEWLVSNGKCVRRELGRCGVVSPVCMFPCLCIAGFWNGQYNGVPTFCIPQWLVCLEWRAIPGLLVHSWVFLHSIDLQTPYLPGH